MKKLVSIAVVLFASMASVNAQNNVLGLDDTSEMVRYMNDNYVDIDEAGVPGTTQSINIRFLKKNGAYVGATAGMQYFNEHFVPFAGAVIGWEGGPKCPIKFEYNGTFNRGNYTKYAHRDNDYLEMDSRGIAAICLYTTPNKQWRFWGGGYFDYKLNFDYHKNEYQTVTVKETDTEIVTTKEKYGSEFEVKGSSMGGGLYGEIAYYPRMSHFSIRGFGGFGWQQRFYEDGNRWHKQAFAGIKVTYNFEASKVYNQSLMKLTGKSKKGIRKAIKNHETVTVNM